MKLRFLFLISLLFVSAAKADLTPLPIWKEKALELGYDLPKALGFSLSYMDLEQGINVDSIALKGLGNIDRFIEMEAEGGNQVTDVVTLRADLWVFPFLNIYGIASKLEGYSETDVILRINIPFLNIPAVRINDFRLDLSGVATGAGIVLAGGYKQWFGLVDASYTQTRLTVIDGSIDAIVVSPRFGYDFKNQGLNLRMWVGAMYQNVEQELSGSLLDLGLSPGIAQLLPDSAGFDVKQQLEAQWNTLFGAQYEINRNWYLLTEVGFGKRSSWFFSVERRF